MNRISELLSATENARILLDPNDPMLSAKALVKYSFTTAEGLLTLHRHRNAFWRWTGSYYKALDDEAIRAKVWEFLEQSFCLVDDHAVAFKPKKRSVADVVAALEAATQLDPDIEAPAWLTKTGMPEPKDLFACGNGLLSLATGELHEPSADFFNLCASEVHYDPNAPEPQEWKAFLGQIFDDDAESIQLQQDWFGYLLSPDTSQQKILLVIGPRRCGKGTSGRVLKTLLGRDSVAGPTISDLQTHFGIEPLITKSLAIFSDARVGKRTDGSVVVERLLTISGEDTMTIGRKFKSAWNGRLQVRLMILTNEIPALAEGSGALAGRFMILVMRKSFFGIEDHGLTDKLIAEAPGILNWAIDGYHSLMKRGRFAQPERSKELEEQIELLSAPVKAFVAECCEVGPGFAVPVEHLWLTYLDWCRVNRRKSVGDKAWFGKHLAAAVPGIQRGRPRDDGDRVPTYSGLQLLPGAAATQAAAARTVEEREEF